MMNYKIYGPQFMLLLSITSICFCHGEALAGESDLWWGKDKAFHFSASFLLTGAGYGIGSACGKERGDAILIGTSIGLGTGMAKELLDLAGLGTPSWKDMTWNVVGVAIGIGVALCFDLAWRGFGNPERGSTENFHQSLVLINFP